MVRKDPTSHRNAIEELFTTNIRICPIFFFKVIALSHKCLITLVEVDGVIESYRKKIYAIPPFINLFSIGALDTTGLLIFGQGLIIAYVDPNLEVGDRFL